MFGPQRVLLDRLASASGPLVTMPRERPVVLALVRKRFAVIGDAGASITELGRAEHARVLGPSTHRDLVKNWSAGRKRKSTAPPLVPARPRASAPPLDRVARRGSCCGRPRELTDAGLAYCKICGRTAARAQATGSAE